MFNQDSWIKYFKDGTSEIGTKELIDKGKASWSNGRLSNLLKVYLSGFDKYIIAEVDDVEWYQFDRFLSNFFSESQDLMTARVLQFKLNKAHLDSYLCYNINKDEPNLIFINSSKTGTLSTRITDQFIDQWVSVILSKTKIEILLSKRGSISGSKSIFG